MKRINTLIAVIIFSYSTAMAQTFTLKSNDLGGQFVNDQMWNQMGYHGKNISPQLSWENAPAGTQSFAVTMYDVDAPSGSGFWHWVVYNIPVDIKEFKTGAGDISLHLLPAGVANGINDTGAPGYIGPGPLPGLPHQYLFTVYALKTSRLEMDKNAPAAYVGAFLNMNVLAKASIVAYSQHP
jgi:Raf kinase inhibitor-like YbhB/YbcL family protein